MTDLQINLIQNLTSLHPDTMFIAFEIMKGADWLEWEILSWNARKSQNRVLSPFMEHVRTHNFACVAEMFYDKIMYDPDYPPQVDYPDITLLFITKASHCHYQIRIKWKSENLVT